LVVEFEFLFRNYNVEVLDKLAIADDRLVIDQSLVDQHSHIFSGCRESALRASRAMVRAPRALGQAWILWWHPLALVSDDVAA
jgi:hypothetical protein